MRIELLILALAGCGTIDIVWTSSSSQQVKACTVRDEADKSTITCPNGSKTVIHKAKNGKDGKNGESIKGDPGESIVGPAGKDGKNGDSIVGPAGESIVGPMGPQGLPGADGVDAPITPFSNVTVVDPCGDAPTVVDEVLLKLGDGTVLASFSDNANGANTRFSLLNPGTYMTSDGSNCVFTVSNDGNITF